MRKKEHQIHGKDPRKLTGERGTDLEKKKKLRLGSEGVYARETGKGRDAVLNQKVKNKHKKGSAREKKHQ